MLNRCNNSWILDYSLGDKIENVFGEFDELHIIAMNAWKAEVVIQNEMLEYVTNKQEQMEIINRTITTETEILKNTIQQQGVFFTTTFTYTGYPILREMKSMLNNGLIDDINFVRSEMLQEGYSVLDNNGESKVPQKWRLRSI